MDKRTSWGLLGHQPYLILDLMGPYGSTAQGLVDIFTAL